MTLAGSGSTLLFCKGIATRLNHATHLHLEYWMDDGWFVGRLKEVPGVFSQGATLAEFEENILDAYELMLEDAVAGTQVTCIQSST